MQVATWEVDGDGDSTDIGVLPAGWQWREGYTHVDHHVKDVNNFPLMDGQTATASGYRDAAKINNNTFRSTALRHWFADLDFNCSVLSRIPAAGASITAGSDKSATRKLSGNHPTGGYLQ